MKVLSRPTGWFCSALHLGTFCTPTPQPGAHSLTPGHPLPQLLHVSVLGDHEPCRGGCPASQAGLNTACSTGRGKYLWSEYMSEYKNGAYHKGNIQQLCGAQSVGVQLNFLQSGLIINAAQRRALGHFQSKNQRTS